MTWSTGRTLVLTGAGGGIGQAVARAFHATGSTLVLVDRDAAPLAELAADLGQRTVTVVADAAEAGSGETAVQAAIEATGRVDDVVLAAGVYPDGLVADISDEDWTRCLQINLTSAFELCRAVVPHLQEGASVVGLTSIAGQRGSRGHAHYAATKGGLLSFLRSLAREVAPAARVNAVAPGTIATGMTQANRDQIGAELLQATPLGRFGTSEEVAGVVHFLCSPSAGFITGEVIAVNGGMHMS